MSHLVARALAEDDDDEDEKAGAAAASTSAAAAVLVWELLKKTKQEYADTLKKLGVKKVCNQKYRPKGSDAPFVLCEATGGLSKNSTCRPCEKRAGKNVYGKLGGGADGGCGGPGCRKRSRSRYKATFKGVALEGSFCKQSCADAAAKAVYKRQHENVDYPEGFEWPPKKGAAAKRKRAESDEAHAAGA